MQGGTGRSNISRAIGAKKKTTSSIRWAGMTMREAIGNKVTRPSGRAVKLFWRAACKYRRWNIVIIHEGESEETGDDLGTNRAEMVRKTSSQKIVAMKVTRTKRITMWKSKIRSDGGAREVAGQQGGKIVGEEHPDSGDLN